MLYCVTMLAGSPASAIELVPGTPIDAALQPGEALQFELAAAPGPQALRLFAVEHGVDLALEVSSGERRLRSNDGDMLRSGEHLLALNLPAATPLSLSVRATRPGTIAGRFRLRADRIDLGSTAQAGAHAVDLIETEVAQRLETPALAAEPRSIAMTRQLLAARLERDDPRGVARAWFAIELFLRRQNRRGEAIATLQTALPSLRRLGDAPVLASALSNIGMNHWNLGDGRRAAEPLREALAIAQSSDQSLLLAVIDNNLCLVVTARRSISEYVDCARRNLELSRRSGDAARIAVSWNNLAGALTLSGQSEQAAQAYTTALELGERNKGRIGDPLANLGLERLAQGRFGEAGDLFARAEAIYRAEDNQRNLALVLRHRGQLAWVLGDTRSARLLLQQALEIQRRRGRREDVVQTLTRIGEIERHRNATPDVPAEFAEAVSLAGIDANPTVLAQTLLRQSLALVEAGRAAEALAPTQQAAALARRLKDSYLQGTAELQFARAALAQNAAGAALAHVRRALPLYRTGAPALRRAELHLVQAQVLEALQRWTDAAAAYAAGIDFVEHARGSIADPESRARFGAARRDLYSGRAALLAEQALRSGRIEQRQAALQAAAQLRARVLREQIEDRREPTPSSAEETALIARETELANARWLAQERGLSAQAQEPLDNELRAVSTRLAALQQHAPAQAAAAELLHLPVAADLAVVQYLVSPQRSYAWVATQGGLELLSLPGEEKIAPLVAAAHAHTTGAATPESPPARPLAALCQAIWQPLQVHIRATRLLLVADGSLRRAPWPALDCADQDSGPSALIDRYEILLAPSLLAANDQGAGPKMSARTHAGWRALAVVDPVYNRDDPRLATPSAASSPLHDRPLSTAPATSSSALALSADEPALARLPATASEAEAMARLLHAPPRVLSGTEASRDAFTALDLRQYDLLHLGTHGVAGDYDLAGSGLVFARYDNAGQALPAFLNARHIARLRLDSRLVVLATCSGADGAALGGEGLLSLGYAFLAAGADNVIAAQWPVADAATARLMEAMYRNLLGGGMSPAGALREAQQSIRTQAAWRHPRYWASFAVYGMERNTDEAR